jgi:O-antigen ligase
MIAGAPAHDRRASLVLLAAVCVAFGLVAGALPNPLLAAGAVCGLAYLVLALVAPVAALTVFVVVTFLSQIGGIGATVSVAKGAGAALVLAWVYNQLVGERRFAAAPLVLRFAIVSSAFIVLGVLSALWATDRHAALSATGRLAQGPLLVLVVASIVRTPKALMTISIAFVAGAAVSAAAGMSGLTHPDQTIVSSGRLSGGIGDPNYLAAVLVPGIALSLFLALTIRSKPMKVAIGLAGVASTAGVFLTESRGGLIALAVAAVGVIVVAGSFRRQVILVLVVLGAFASCYLLLVAPPQSFHRITSFTSNGGTGRTDIWTVAAKTFEQHPFFGVGAGNFTVVEQSYAVDIDQNLPRADLVVQNHEPVHNTYLHVASELGSVGLLLFLGMLALAFTACWRAIKATSRPDLSAIGRGLVVGYAGMLVAFVFLTAQYEKQLWLVVAMLFATAGTVAATARDGAQRPRPRLRLQR